MTFLRLTAAKKGFVAETHMTFVYLHHLPYLRSFYFCFLYATSSSASCVAAAAAWKLERCKVCYGHEKQKDY